ncbi:hypothetical protein RclHR1_09140007 [Rhizophagus clarus]|uniref:Uncharacterized protein n=1 Tax=Rhizophagus clarus TaxID=94130 RepID=A0A2Z6SPP7_9GLOM|nr:hypothetical protein RclHR1_09140007 [Rhizophagus clarus]
MTRTDTNIARRKLRSSHVSRGQNNKRKHNKPSKAVRRRHFRRKGIDKPQESEGLAQQALGITASLFMEKEELEKKVVHKEDEIGHLKETEDQNRLLRTQVQSLTLNKSRLETKISSLRQEREGWHRKFVAEQETAVRAVAIANRVQQSPSTPTTSITNLDNFPPPPPTV